MADYVLIASLKKIYDSNYLSTLTTAGLSVNIGELALAKYASWKTSWNKDLEDQTLWTDHNTYPIYLFTDPDMLELDNILKDRFTELFKILGKNLQILNLLGNTYDV